MAFCTRYFVVLLIAVFSLYAFTSLASDDIDDDLEEDVGDFGGSHSHSPYGDEDPYSDAYSGLGNNKGSKELVSTEEILEFVAVCYILLYLLL